MRNNPKLNPVIINAYAKFDQIPLIHFQAIERKRIVRMEPRHHGMTDNLKTVYPPPILCMQGVKKIIASSEWALWHMITVKIPAIRTPNMFAVIILKFKQCGFIEWCVQMMQTEWQTV